jgi:BirA family biotin operon repressor/biotin-[acetyl-CoA-carboxylase] ligase
VTSDPAARPPLDKARLGSGNPELMPDLTVEVVDSLGSTNAEVARRAVEGAPDGLVVVADHQTGGRGRLDRTWESPAGTSVTFSILLRPESPTRSWPWLPLLTGYAVDKALRASGLEAGVKWPNDVLVGDKKVAGILVERVETPDGPAAVVGVGINVSLTADELPVPTATSLELELGRPVDRTDVLVECLNAIREAVDAWELGGDDSGMGRSTRTSWPTARPSRVARSRSTPPASSSSSPAASARSSPPATSCTCGRSDARRFDPRWSRRPVTAVSRPSRPRVSAVASGCLSSWRCRGVRVGRR